MGYFSAIKNNFVRELLNAYNTYNLLKERRMLYTTVYGETYFFVKKKKPPLYEQKEDWIYIPEQKYLL